LEARLMSGPAFCPVCKSAAVELRGAYRGAHPAFQGLQRAHCTECGMVFADPMPNAGALTEYNSSYFASAHGGVPKAPIARAFFSAIAKLRLAYLEHYLMRHGVQAKRVLELGPGPGYLAGSWIQRHAGGEYLAIETDSSCHADLKRLGVQLLDGQKNESNSSVDLVVMSHVLEHVTDPVAFLSEAVRGLRRGGALFVEVPCRDWEHKPLDEPHLLFFDKEPMRHLLDKLGFRSIEVNYYGQEIERLRANSKWHGKLMGLRSKLISMGLRFPFSRQRPGMEILGDPLERAAVAPFNAHVETTRPAWWLRAVAIKVGDQAPGN
jgi:SAM-dependent methyltransferase